MIKPIAHLEVHVRCLNRYKADIYNISVSLENEINNEIKSFERAISILKAENKKKP